MISFVVQNETHALNFAPIVEHLLTTGVSEKCIEVLHLDPIFGMKTYDRIQVPGRRILELPIPEPYYWMSPYRRLTWLLRVAPALHAAVADTKVVVFGSDGGIQRVLANAVRARGGRAILLFDGLLNPWPAAYPARLKSLFKCRLNNLAVRLGLNPFVPADIGHSSLDQIFVMCDPVRAILLDQGVKTPIEVVQLPRLDGYYERFAALRAAGAGGERRCLYITGAYRWHGMHHFDAIQQRDLVDLRRFAERNPDWRIRVRIHPREDYAAYTGVSWPPNIELSFPERPAIEDLAWASVMVTYLSTMAVEAELVGVPVVLYMANFPALPPGSYFDRNPSFTRITDLDMLRPFTPPPAAPRQPPASSVPHLTEAIRRGYSWPQ
jgi:hypothetical protein